METFWCMAYEHVCEKTNNLGFRPGQTQISLYSHRRMKEEEGLYCPCSENKGADQLRGAKLVVTAKLVCAFVFAFIMQGIIYFRHVISILIFGCTTLRKYQMMKP